MRIVNTKEFLGLPSNILYSKYKPSYFDGLCIKTDTFIGGNKINDFCYQNLIAELDASGSNEAMDILIDAEKDSNKDIYQTSWLTCNRCARNDKEYVEMFGEPKEII